MNLHISNEKVDIYNDVSIYNEKVDIYNDL